MSSYDIERWVYSILFIFFIIFVFLSTYGEPDPHIVSSHDMVRLVYSIKSTLGYTYPHTVSSSDLVNLSVLSDKSYRIYFFSFW